jgi:CubicO group peptidase (beta-lactamase class C family)
VNTGRFDAAVDALVHRAPTGGVTNALLVVADGRIVTEWYGEGLNESATHISWSMAKSITHALVGIAVRDGLLDVSNTNLLSEWSEDERSQISLRDLLMMRSGLSWVEDYVDENTSDVIDMLFGESEHTGDHASYAASKPLAHPPGTFWEYSSGTTNIVARILASALGESLGSHDAVLSYMNDRLFGPIGMSAIPKFDEAGTFVGSSFVYATARDFARFGYLYLCEGEWNGTRILPVGWTSECAVAHAVDEESGMGYSHHWWTRPSDTGSMIAQGYEGQFTWVSPSRNVVLVHLGKTSAEYGNQLRSHLEAIVSEFPAREANVRHDG